MDGGRRVQDRVGGAKPAHYYGLQGCRSGVYRNQLIAAAQYLHRWAEAYFLTKNEHLMKNKPTFRTGGKPCLMRTFLITVLFTLSLSGCDDFVEVDLPSSQLPSEAVFEDYTTATAAMVNIYAQLRNNGLLNGNPGSLAYKLGEYADEMTFYGAAGQTDVSFPNNTVLPTNTDIIGWWNTTYNQIYAANSVLEGVGTSKVLSPGQKERLRGEALFIRALLHFYLTNSFGAVPYVETTDYRINSTVTRMPVEQVHEHIISDLTEAESLLEIDYITFDRVRPNKATVQALLARVYLYTGRWAAAADHASAVLNQEDLYSWEPDLDAVFKKESMTTIWHLMPASDGLNTHEAAAHVFLQGPPPVSSLSESLVGAFETGDNRRARWIKEVGDGSDTWYHAYKYQAIDNTGSSVEYSVMFRTAELYLIRAEARARQGELANATGDVNRIRNTAGLGNTSAGTMEQLLLAIEQERRVELFTEGHRFFDLKRTGRLDAVLGSKPGWQPTDALLPLPESELLLNPALNPQNPGY